MTLSRWLLGLTLILSFALPPDASAMLRNEAGRLISNDNDNNNDNNNDDDNDDNDIPPPPDDDVSVDEEAREEDPARAAQSAAIQRGLAEANQQRRRRAIAASVAFMLEQAEDGERPAVAARLSQSLDDFDILPPDEVADIAAAVEASLAAPAAAAESSSSSSTSTAAAKAASAAAAPARAVVALKGRPTRVQADARDPLSRGLPPPEFRRGTSARLDRPDLGARNVRQSHADLEQLLNRNIHFFPRSGDNPHLRNVRDALQAANDLLPALRADPVGQMPPKLAGALISAADRAGRAAVPSGRAPNSFVRTLADPDRGIVVDRLDDAERTAPVERVAALDALIQAATAAAAEEVPGSALQRSLKAAAREALDDRTRLVAFLADTARSFPRAFATVRLPADQLGAPVRGGLNSAPRPLRYDFATGTVRAFGPATALFKPMEIPTIEKPLIDGGLSSTGVVEFNEVPSRLEQRSLATRRVAELLGIGDLVVDMQIAHLDNEVQTVGLLMARAPGEPGIVERTDFPEATAFLAYQGVLARMAEAQAMIDFLDGKTGNTRPSTPLVTAAEPASGAWNRGTWLAHGTDLANSLLDIPVRDIGPPGAPNLVGVLQERPITDAHLANPDLRRQLSNAQWLDLLCGQVDRHMGNLFLDTSGAAFKVTLIDNDLAFGIKNDVYGLDDPAATPQFRLPPKPFTVDAGFKKAIMSLDKTRLRQATEGLLTDAEQDSLIERLRVLKTYMKERDGFGRLKVKEVHPPGTRGRGGALRWDADPATLFRGHNNPNPNPTRGDEYSYYGILAALPPRPAAAAPAPGGN